jgi:hypothetical protein
MNSVVSRRQVRPLVEPRYTERQRQKQDDYDRQCSRRRLEDPAYYETPGTTRQVLQKEEADRADTDAAPEDKS